MGVGRGLDEAQAGRLAGETGQACRVRNCAVIRRALSAASVVALMAFLLHLVRKLILLFNILSDLFKKERILNGSTFPGGSSV